MSYRPDQDVGKIAVTTEGAIERTYVSIVGAAATLNNKYFIFSSSGVNYYVWYNYNATGTDPAVASKTAVPVAVAVAASSATIATNTAAAIEALALLNSQSDGTTVIIRGDVINPVTNAGAGTSGFTVDVQSEGRAVSGSYPAKLVDSFSNTPSAIV